jgi:hypothetical protein
MAIKRAHGECYIRKAVCRRKRRYVSRTAAEAAAAAALYLRQAALVVAYPCGRHWHIGHDRRR